MFIKYNGPKKTKTLEFNTKQWGLITHVFDPIAEISDPDIVKFLLHPYRKGLFSTVNKDDVPVVEEQIKRRGRPRKEVADGVSKG
jgi:hypothetical protein